MDRAPTWAISAGESGTEEPPHPFEAAGERQVAGRGHLLIVGLLPDHRHPVPARVNGAPRRRGPVSAASCGGLGSWSLRRTAFDLDETLGVPRMCRWLYKPDAPARDPVSIVRDPVSIAPRWRVGLVSVAVLVLDATRNLAGTTAAFREPLDRMCCPEGVRQPGLDREWRTLWTDTQAANGGAL